MKKINTSVFDIEKDSLAERAGIEPGDIILAAGGHEIHDILEYKFLTAEYEVSLTVQKKDGSVKELLCSYVPESKSGSDTSGIKTKGVIQWVNADDCVDMEIRQYGHLLKDEEYAGQDFSERMNKESVKISFGKVEPYILENDYDAPYQLLRTGYFKRLNVNGKEIISEIVSLKDNYNVKK